MTAWFSMQPLSLSGGAHPYTDTLRNLNTIDFCIFLIVAWNFVCVEVLPVIETPASKRPNLYPSDYRRLRKECVTVLRLYIIRNRLTSAYTDM